MRITQLLPLLLVGGILTACAAPTQPATTPTSTGATPASTTPPPSTPLAPTRVATAATVPTAATTPAPVATATKQPLADEGFLEGHASIGPLSPVERAGVPTPTPSPAVCTSRGLAVYDASGQTLVTSFSFQPDCNYRVPLKPGSYVLKVTPQQGIGGARGLPQTVTIESGETTRLDVDIDTGIR